ncbi:hypothetical protein H2248_008514 [Termitomyces sp. 'cryptogamus']|nr:hypothetical protein H2248_008514 [Termitomyces sp. 'cryptogamus']
MPPSNRPMNLMQTLIDSAEFSLLKLPIQKIQELEIDQDTFAEFDHAKPIGISPGYSSKGKLIALAVADDKSCMIVDFNVLIPRNRSARGGQNMNSSTLPRNLDDLEEKILCRPAGELFAFDMGPLCLSIYTDANLRVTHAVDIQSGLSAVDRKPLTAIKNILGTSVTIKEQNVANVFYHPVYDPDDRKSATDLAQRAWISQLLAVYGDGEVTLGKVPRIDTQKFPTQKLKTLAKNTNDTLRQNLNKPMKIRHDISIATNGQDPTATSQRFSNKLRRDQTVVLVTETTSGSQYTTRGKVGNVRGKAGQLSTNHSLDGKLVTSVISIGRDDPTTAEAQRAATVLRVLQGFEQLMDDSPWIQNIFFPSDDADSPLTWPLAWSQANDTSPAHFDPVSETHSPNPLELLPLNSSQQHAVNTMCSPLDVDRITIIQGPPGTGKTSVIASFVQLSIQDGIWLVAQSNVAVKNIAEKLIKTNFLDWRLLVSKDFIFEWHEHIYAQDITNRIITSDHFKWVTPKDIQGCRVILCTLSMLANPHIVKFTSQNPIKTLIVDEASQIEINNYVSVLVTSSRLRKMCFIGDDKQLPPFGQEDLQDLQSIFEVPHLRPHALFLDTQYRMPPQIGNIISDLVYDGKLKSNPLHPITEKTQACRFIDIPGQEERNEDSYMNLSECDAVIKLAWHLQEQQKAYQIITPYDGQRSIIEGKMKQVPDLNWENKCFNVDSFQGNEEDYIIISLVRSRGVGFLDNKRRTNVMLTRCKKGMFIVSSRRFLSGHGANTLVGELAERLGPGAWLEQKDLEEGKF